MTVTHNDQHPLIGQVVQLSLEGNMSAPVLLTDARVVYGREQFLVAPVGGRGARWVSRERLSIEKDHERRLPEE